MTRLLFHTRPEVIIGASALLLAIWYIVSTIRQYIHLRHFGGPAIAGFTKFWMIRNIRGNRSHEELHEVCQKYGDIARIGPNDLITSDPDLLKRMLHVRTPYIRSAWYSGFRLDPRKDNILSQRDNALHGKIRSIMTPAYSGKEVDNIESNVNDNVQRFVDLLETNYISKNKPFDFGYKVQYLTIDVISSLAFGEPFGDIETDSDVHGYIRSVEETLPPALIMGVMPWTMKLLQLPIFSFLLPSEKDSVGVGRTMAIAKRVAAERFGPGAKAQRDMIGSFIARGLDQSELESEILLQLLAGADTTATAIRATVLYIISNPRVLEKIRAEISRNSFSGPIISDSEARAMPYLQAVIKEGLRIHPPVASLMSKEVPKGGDTFKGHYLPEGTNIGYCAWGIFRKKDIWGDDSEEFRPERWLEAPEDELRRMEGALEFIFGYGRWQCLGKNIALMELNKVIPELFRRFDLGLLNPIKPWHSLSIGIFHQNEYWIRGFKRESV